MPFMTKLDGEQEDDQKNIMDDETIKLNGSQTPFRLIHDISPEDQHEYHFITNAMHLSAQTIADVYKERWQIELF